MHTNGGVWRHNQYDSKRINPDKEGGEGLQIQEKRTALINESLKILENLIETKVQIMKSNEDKAIEGHSNV